MLHLSITFCCFYRSQFKFAENLMNCRFSTSERREIVNRRKFCCIKFVFLFEVLVGKLDSKNLRKPLLGKFTESFEREIYCFSLPFHEILLQFNFSLGFANVKFPFRLEIIWVANLRVYFLFKPHTQRFFMPHNRM